MGKKGGAVTVVIAVFSLCLSLFCMVSIVSQRGEIEKNEGIQYVMYVGTNDKDTYKLEYTEEEAKELVDQICLKYFDGYTLQEAVGSWKDEKDKVTREYTLVCYYNEQEDTGSKFVFVDDSDNEFENYLDQVSMSTTYDEDEDEEIIDASEETAEDGTKLIHLTTKYDDPNIVNTLYESFSYPSDEYTRIGHYYTLRAESYEILKASLYFAKDDGTEQVAFKIEITAGTKEPEIPDALYEKTLKGDQRTLTLTVDPGTDHSRIITETVTKGSSFEVFDVDALYKDEACTKLLKDDTDKNSDVKLYCKSGS